MHLSRDTHKLLNESVRSLSLEEEYQVLSEEQFNEHYEEYINYLAENFTDEELEQMTEEDLMEGFFSRLAGAAGTAVHRTGNAIKNAGKTFGDMKTQYQRGAAGELTWTGAEKYPTKEEPKKAPTPPPPPDAKKTTPTKPVKLTPEQRNKLRTDPRFDALRTRRAARQKTNDEFSSMTLKQRLQSKGLVSDKGKKTAAGKAAASSVKDKSAKVAETLKKTQNKNAAWQKAKSINPEETLSLFKKHNLNKGHISQLNKHIEKTAKEKGIKLRKKDYPQIHAHFLNLISGKKSTSGMKMNTAQASKALFDNKQYYSDLRQRLIENYKK